MSDLLSKFKKRIQKRKKHNPYLEDLLKTVNRVQEHTNEVTRDNSTTEDYVKRQMQITLREIEKATAIQSSVEFDSLEENIMNVLKKYEHQTHSRHLAKNRGVERHVAQIPQGPHGLQ